MNIWETAMPQRLPQKLWNAVNDGIDLAEA
jgi:hypothetical protein